jgi:hypothetical protein
VGVVPGCFDEAFHAGAAEIVDDAMCRQVRSRTTSRRSMMAARSPAMGSAFRCGLTRMSGS